MDSKIEQCKILLVGAGGIGCEVLKNLTLTGFKNIDVIDMDTIDVSNLNRQFLFNKSNVGQSKSEVSVAIAIKEYAKSQANLNIKAIHKSITLSEFDIDYFRQYSLVINALDNRAARSHVNRMCLAAETPLLESGTSGYLGNLKLIKNNLTACYDCEGIQKDARTFATCTIRNTPSQPIHCIVWAKHLFHQLFGEDDPDNDVSPQMDQVANGPGESVKKISTREWATTNNYDPLLLFEKIYICDIQYLLSMDNLWKERARPNTLDYNQIMTNSSTSNRTAFEPWTLKDCVEVFCESIKTLYGRMKTSGYLHWDKDDQVALDFVVASSNLRSRCFNIERKSPFDVKSLAGNIVPAISSTNSIIAGLMVLQTMKLLKSMPIGEEYRKMNEEDRNKLLKDAAKETWLCHTSLTRPNLICSTQCDKPKPNCLACSRESVQEVEIHLSMKNTSLGDLIDKIVMGTFAFVCPDISLNDTSGTIIWSKDEDTENPEASNQTRHKRLNEFPHIKSPKTRLLITDLIQDKELVLVLIDEEIDEEKHNNFFYALMNGVEI